MPANVVRDGAWELDHQLSDITIGRFVWKQWDGEKLILRTDYHVDPLLKATEATRNDTAGERWGEWRHVSSMPLNLYHSSGFAEAQRQGDKKWLNRWHNDSDNAAWRTFEGRV